MKTKTPMVRLRAYVGPYQALVARQVGEAHGRGDDGFAFWEPVEGVFERPGAAADGVDQEEARVLVGWQYPSRGGILRLVLTPAPGIGRVGVNGKAYKVVGRAQPIEVLAAPAGPQHEYTLRIEVGGAERVLVLMPSRIESERPHLVAPAGAKEMVPEDEPGFPETEALDELTDSVLAELGAGRPEKAWALMDETFRRTVSLAEFTRATAAVAPTLKAMQGQPWDTEGGAYASKRWIFGRTKRIRSKSGAVRVDAVVGWANGRFGLLDLSIGPDA